MSFGCVVALGLAGAAYTATQADPEQPGAEPSGLPRSAPRDPLFSGAIATMPAPDELSQDASRLAFAAPTDLGLFASRAPHAPVLESTFVSLALHAPAAAPSLLAEAAPMPAAVPLPLANPFRTQSTEPDAAASRKSKLASRAPVRATASAEANGEMGILQRLFGASQPQPTTALAYAPVESGDLRGWPAIEPQRRGGSGEKTAIYDISARTVTMPNGRRLEAHSGLGDLLDDPRSISMKNRGVTPPNIYTLRLRESLFHGVRAIRLIPEHASRMFGRDGILAHTYMLGPRGDSNGCISFRDYDAFLEAFLNGEVTRIVVIDSPSSTFALAAARR